MHLCLSCFCLYGGEGEPLCFLFAGKSWFSHHHFNGFCCIPERRICTEGRLHASTTTQIICHDTDRNLQKSDPNQTLCAEQKTKTIRDKHSNWAHMKASSRPETGAEMQRIFTWIRYELWGGQLCSRLNFTEGQSQSKSHIPTQALVKHQFPLHICSAPM